MLIKVEGCIWPKCQGGLNCSLAELPDRCDADLTELERANYEDEIKVREGKEAAKRIQKRKRKYYQRQWFLEHKEERRVYQREYARKKKNIQKENYKI